MKVTTYSMSTIIARLAKSMLSMSLSNHWDKTGRVKIINEVNNLLDLKKMIINSIAGLV